LDGYHFDSDLELKRCCYLRHVQMAAALRQLTVHPGSS
jgi:hypothetical protein